MKRKFDAEVAAAKRRRQLSYATSYVIPRNRQYRVTANTYRPRSSYTASREHKWADFAFQGVVSAVADWTGTEVPCTGYIASDATTLTSYTSPSFLPAGRGVGYGQVVGSSYYLDKVRVRGSLSVGALADQADVVSPSVVRLVLVMDTRAEGVQAQGEDVFPDMGNQAQCNYSFQFMAKNADRFKILADKTITVQPAVAGTDGANTLSVSGQVRTWKMSHAFKKPPRVVVSGSDSSNGVAQLQNYNVFLLAHCDNTAHEPTLYACARVYYHE